MAQRLIVKLDHDVTETELERITARITAWIHSGQKGVLLLQPGVVLQVLDIPTPAEHDDWTCTWCGRTGNRESKCAGCGHPEE